MATWLQEILQSHSEVESPQSFYYWSALAALSAVVKDNVWIDRGGLYNLYPNIYVMLHADSGMKKGPPVGLARNLVKKVNNTRIINGRSSIQGILKELGTAYTSPGGKINSKSTGFYIASEFSSSLVEDSAAMRILTDLYDRHYNEGEWKSLLKNENFSLKDPILTMLVATNEAMLEDFVTAREVHGGFYARTFIIHEHEENKSNSLILPLKSPPDVNHLCEYLKVVSQVSGPFMPMGYADGTMTNAGKMFDDWYHNLKREVKGQQIKDETGTLNRIGDSVIKVAMLLSLAESSEKIIQETHMLEAIAVSEKLIGNIRKATMGKGKMAKSVFTQWKAMIINELLERDGHSITRTQLLKKYSLHFNSGELDEMMLTFDQSGQIKTEMAGNQILYRMLPLIAQAFKDHLAGKNKQ